MFLRSRLLAGTSASEGVSEPPAGPRDEAAEHGLRGAWESTCSLFFSRAAKIYATIFHAVLFIAVVVVVVVVVGGGGGGGGGGMEKTYFEIFEGVVRAAKRSGDYDYGASSAQA